MNKPQIINTLKVITLALVLSFGIQFAAAQSTTSWTPPQSAPPSGNTYAPLNIGTSGQVKDGGLTLGYSLNGTSAGLIVPKAAALFGTTVVPNNGAKISVAGTEADSSAGTNTLMTFESLNSAGTSQSPAAYYHKLRLGTDHSLNIDSFSGSWNYAMSIRPDRQVTFGGNVRIPTGGGTGKILMSSNNNGVAKWATRTTYQANVGAGEARVDTNATSQTSFCALTRSYTGGCDSGAACSVEWSASAGRYQVVAQSWGDCDDGHVVECTAVCLE